MPYLSQVSVDFLHVFPLLLIAMLYTADMLRNKYAKLSALISDMTDDKKDICTLVLSAVGIAFGSTSHSCGSSFVVDPCIFYSIFLFATSIRIGSKKAAR